MAILVVDNDPAQRQLLKSMLHKLGYETVVREGQRRVVAARRPGRLSAMSSRPRAAPYFSTRSANCRRRRR